LIFALNDEDIMVKSNAALALGKLGNDAKTAIPDLIHLLKYTEFRISSSAAIALGEIGNKKVLDQMEAIIKNKNGKICQIIEESIEKIRLIDYAE